MQIHYDIEQLPLFHNAVITIGAFDGVHLGHRQIIASLKAEAATIGGETVIITFHPHPRKILASSGRGILLINTLEEKLELLEQLGIEHVVVVPFTSEFANQPAEEYVRHFLMDRFHPHTLIIGYDHRFGKEREGDYLLLEKMAPELGFELKEIPKHMLDQVSISSTRIRESLLEGKIEIADKLLGYEFFFSGRVIKGDQLGRTLGYPTANLQMPEEEKITPGNGIYAVYAQAEGDKEIYKAMMSIGVRPTVNGKNRVIEVNIFDFGRDLYGQMLRVYVKKYLREEVKFGSLEALTTQIGLDKIESLKWL